MIDLTGRVALVTGGSRGIGWACVETLAKAGAECALTYRTSKEAALEAVQLLRDQGTVAEAVRLDAADPASAQEAIDEVLDRLGRIDILVNNAGIWNVQAKPLTEMSVAEIDEMLAVNLRGVMLITLAAVQDMLKRSFGRVVSIGSTAGLRGEAGHSHYAASKGALHAWTRSLVHELSPRGITVNTVSPGWVFTDMTRDALTPENVARIESEIPTRRLTRPDDVAAAVAFLASPFADQITGANLNVNGGSVMA